MLFYLKCPSCSRIISFNLDKYHEDLNMIRENPKLTKAQKEEAGANLLKKYNYKKYCCRSRILGLIPYHEIIQT